MKVKIKKPTYLKKLLFAATIAMFVIFLGVLYISFRATTESISVIQIQALDLGTENEELKKTLTSNLEELNALKDDDQYKINLELRARVNNVESTYLKAVSTYEELLKLKESTSDTDDYDKRYTDALVLLSKQNYEEAETKLASLSSDISLEQEKITASFNIPKSVPINNTPPGSGYSRQTVQTDIGQYLVSLVAGDLSSTRVIVDTASASDCHNDCPVLPLATYVSRNNAYAGINGSYFCPATYPSCAGKTNSFDTLLMNKDKTYFNSDNNVYSNVPAVIFGGGYIRFVSQSLEWGRDTGIDGMLANQALLVHGGNIVFGGDGDPKKGSKAGRSFVSNQGSRVYIGVVHSATVAEAAIVLKAMNMENALNLDSGGSTALYSGGYKLGPGRDIPNAILFVQK